MVEDLEIVGGLQENQNSRRVTCHAGNADLSARRLGDPVCRKRGKYGGK